MSLIDNMPPMHFLKPCMMQLQEIRYITNVYMLHCPHITKYVHVSHNQPVISAERYHLWYKISVSCIHVSGHLPAYLLWALFHHTTSLYFKIVSHI